MNTMPLWLQAHQQKNLHAFEQQGIPTRKNERWKYTDLSQVTKLCAATHVLPEPEPTHANSSLGIGIVLNNGYLQERQNISGDVIVCSLAEAIKNHEALLKQYWDKEIDATKYPFASLNAAHATDGLFIYVPDNFTLLRSLHLLINIHGNSEFVTHPQHVIVLGKNSQLKIIEEYKVTNPNPCMLNQVRHIFLDEGAQFESYKLQHNGVQAVQITHQFVQQQTNSQATFMNFVSGNAFCREELQVKLLGQDAVCNTRGLYHLKNKNEYLDNHIDIIHSAPNTKSEMLYKGILENQSRAVFNGKLLVEQHAQKILAYQANHNLLLSNDSEVYSKPELEIYADDVKCKHGASTGQLDEEALFYLRSRGIEYTEAKKLLLTGFAEDVLQHIDQAELKQYIKEFMTC